MRRAEPTAAQDANCKAVSAREPLGRDPFWLQCCHKHKHTHTHTVTRTHIQSQQKCKYLPCFTRVASLFYAPKQRDSMIGIVCGCCACCTSRCRYRCRSVEDAAAVAWQRALKSRSSHTPLNFKWSRNAFSATQREPPTATSTWTASASVSASVSAGLSLRLRRARAMTPRIPLCYSDMFIKMHGKPEVRQKENSTKSSSDGLKPLEQRSHRVGSIRSRGRLEGDKSPELRPWANLRHNWRRVHVAIGAACTFNAYEILRGISQPYKWYGNELPLALLPPSLPTFNRWFAFNILVVLRSWAELSEAPNYQPHSEK